MRMRMERKNIAAAATSSRSGSMRFSGTENRRAQKHGEEENHDHERGENEDLPDDRPGGGAMLATGGDGNANFGDESILMAWTFRVLAADRSAR